MRPSRVKVLAVLLLLVPVAACSDDEPGADDAAGSWKRAAQMPLSPRTDPQVGWTGSEVLVVGGDVGVPANPSADGDATDEFVRSGAAYDPETDSWRVIHDAPEEIPYYYRSTMVGDVMVLQTVADDGATGWLAYDASDDAWTRLPDPPEPAEDNGWLSANDAGVVTMSKRGTVEVLDLDTATWTVLPADPGLRRVRGLGCVVVGDGDDVYVSGDQIEGVHRWDGTAWTTLDADGCFEAWTGRVLTDFQMALDPATGESVPLPGAPDAEKDTLPDHIAAGAVNGPLAAVYGYVYDDRAGTWTPYGRPDSPVDVHTGATFAGDRLVVVAGLDEDAGYEDTSGLSDDAWLWTPPG